MIKMQLKKITLNKNVKKIKAKKNNVWDIDKKNFLLIRINKETDKLEVSICDYKNYRINYIVYGNDPEEIYQTVIREGFITKLSHAAYLGRELEKAFICKKLNIKYIQDNEIVFDNINK